jgi:hypothetical protein
MGIPQKAVVPYLLELLRIGPTEKYVGAGANEVHHLLVIPHFSRIKTIQWEITGAASPSLQGLEGECNDTAPLDLGSPLTFRAPRQTVLTHSAFRPKWNLVLSEFLSQ